MSTGVLRTVGRYEIRREVGRGGMSVVYLARQTDLDRDVALKELAAFHAVDPAFAERFLRESRVAGSLTHANVVTVHEYFEHDGVPYIAMEYLDRGSLRPVMQRLSLSQIAGVLEAVFAGLAYAHSRGIVHRDMKPENLLITAQGGVKIADFGIAKALNQAQTGRYLTATGTTVGTPAYMAPEQAMGKTVGPWTDLYSAGVIAYELLAGQVPFADTDTPVAILLKHVSEPVPSPETVRPDLDPRLSRWLGQLLVKDPADRTQSALEAWDQLEEIVISMLGPRWRRAARLLESHEQADPPKPLTPAPFHEESVVAPVAEEAKEDPKEFVTFLRGKVKTETEAAGLAEPAAVHEEAQVTLPPRAPDAVQAPEAAEAPDAAVPEPAAEPPAPTEATPELVDGVFKTYLPRVPVVPPQAAEDTAGVDTSEPTQAPPVPLPAQTEDALAGVANEAAETIPPKVRRTHPSFQFPSAELGRKRRLRLLALVGAFLLVAVGVVAFILLRGGSDEAAPPPPPPEVLPAADQVPGLAAGRSSTYITAPSGRVVSIDNSSLKRAAAVTDAAAPHGVALGKGNVYVVDDKGVLVFRGKGLTPTAAARFRGGTAIAAGSLGDAVVASDSGRVCVLRGSRLSPCLALGFSPTGVGVAGKRAYVANGKDGSVVELSQRGDKLVAGRRFSLGKASTPHGTPVASNGRLYVPVKRGIAAFNLSTGKVANRIALRATPTAIWISPSNGRLFASLYGADKLAVVDTAFPERKPVLIPTGDGPVAVTGSRSGVYVVNARDATIQRHDALSGRRLGAATRVAALKLRTIAPTTATGIPIAAKGRNVTAKMRFTGALDAGSLAVLDSAIADGRAVVQVWQGGIKTSVARRRAAGLGVRIAESPARLVVVLTAKPGRFVSLRTRLTDHGKAVLLQLRKAPPPRPRVVSRPSVTPRPSKPRYVPPRPPAPKYEPIPLP